MIYVTLPSSSMDIYPDNKISSFKVNLPETLQVDPEQWFDLVVTNIPLIKELNSNS